MTLPLFDLNHWFARADGRYDLSLSHSGCQPLTAAEFLNEDELPSFLNESLGYGPVDGFADLRQVIADQYQTMDSGQVMTFHGPSEVIYTFMQAMVEPGDKVVVPTPLFYTLHSIARHKGCDMHQWRPTDETSCTFDVADLAKICDRSTKLIVINFPHNPTGQMISESELRQIVDIAKSADAMLVSDEVFRLLELPPHQPLPAACDLYDKAVSINGLSKPFGLGGLRLGWLATRCDEIRDAVKQYRYYTTEMTNTPCQWLATRAMQQQEKILNRNRALILANLDRLEAFVETHNGLLKLTRPKAGTMAVVEQRTDLTSSEFCERVLNEEQVFLIPGKLLGMSDRLLRFGLGMSDFEQGLERLDRFMRSVPLGAQS